MSEEAHCGNNAVTCIRAGTRGFVLSRRNMLALPLVCLALLISLSCSSKEKTPGNESKESAKKTVILPSGAMPLSAVLKAVESAGYAPVIEVEFEKDHWKTKAYSNGRLLQLKIDLFTGAVLPSPPPTLEKPLSAVVKGLEDQGYGPILDIERGSEGSEGGVAWEVEGYKGSTEVAVNVEPASGKITTK